MRFHLIQIRLSIRLSSAIVILVAKANYLLAVFDFAKRTTIPVLRKKLFPFFDCAYQGFASGSLDTDAWAVRFVCACAQRPNRLRMRTHSVTIVCAKRPSSLLMRIAAK